MTMKNYLLTPEDFLNRKERQVLMKTCKERSELDLMKGRQTWPVRYMLIDLALYSGLRVAEIASLKVGDIFLIKDPYLIIRHGKGDKCRVVYIDNKLADHISDHLRYKRVTLGLQINVDAPLFSGRDGKHSPPITLMKSFKIAIQKAGHCVVLFPYISADIHMQHFSHHRVQVIFGMYKNNLDILTFQ